MARRVILLLGFLPALGCAHAAQVTWKLDDPAVMRDVLAEHIPRGTPLSDARQFMEREGFSCALVQNGVFVARRAWFEREPRYEGLDFLHCSRSQSAGSFLMGRHWSVALVHDGKVVTDVLVSHYVDGP